MIMLQSLKAGRLQYRASILLGILLLLSFTIACAPAPSESESQPEQQSQVEQNKEIAVAFFNMIFNEHKVAEAFETYSVPDYIQHNPYAATGAQPAIDFLGPYLEQNPEARAEIKRVIAENDLVAIHNNPKANAEDLGRAVVDIFRLENGKVVEHWDVVQDVPAESANENTMF
jgi:predicted SnoaL-like aldol condensation-catalyzing enzyme